MTNNLSFRRAVRLGLAAAVATVLLSACGGDDGSSPSTPSVPASTPAPPPPTPAPPPPITAEEVVDGAGLQSFVEAAAAAMSEAASTPEEAYAFADETFRPPGAWNHDDIYLYIVLPDGTTFFHAANQALEGQNLWDLRDLRGVFFMRELVGAAQAGSGFVRYFWENPTVEGDEEDGSPKLGFGVPVTIGDMELIVGSGIYPPITAADVLNRNLLQRFVERALATAAAAAASPEEAYPFMDATFRPPGEWRHDDIYLFVVSLDGVVFFHGADMAIEGHNLWDREDLNGLLFVRELVAAARAGGGFVQYHWDNPVVEGDEVDGSPKVSYAALLALGTTDLTLGAGIYLE